MWNSLSLQNSLICGASSLLRTHGEELRDDFERHALRFRNLEENEEPWRNAYNGINSEHADQANGREHQGEWISDDDVADPERECTDRNANATHPSREDLGAQDVRDRAKPHDKATEVDNDTGSWDGGVHEGANVDDAADD